MKTVTAFQCYLCGELNKSKHSAKSHFEYHAKERLANRLLKKGRTLEEIRTKCGFYWELSESQKHITQDNCFVISYLQCCDSPAYRICFINGSGEIKVSGVGGWSGGYASYVKLHSLENPQPLDKLYIY
jgi:hypothetical protein